MSYQKQNQRNAYARALKDIKHFMERKRKVIVEHNIWDGGAKIKDVNNVYIQHEKRILYKMNLSTFFNTLSSNMASIFVDNANCFDDKVPFIWSVFLLFSD